MHVIREESLKHPTITIHNMINKILNHVQQLFTNE